MTDPAIRTAETTDHAVASGETSPAGRATRSSQPIPGEPVRHPWRTVLRDQRKTCLVALGFMVASFWIIGPLGRWELAGCVAGGVVLGLINHLALERWLLHTISSGQTPTRGALIRASLARLTILTVVAIGAAIALWPAGIGLLLGLAVFRLIALAMTSVALLKELKNQ